MKKTKFLVSGVDLDVLKTSGIECVQCKLWVHSTNRLVADPNYVCPRCNGKARQWQNCDWSRCRLGGHFLLLGWHTVLCRGAWQWHCRQMFRGLGKVQETFACLTTRHLSPKLHAMCSRPMSVRLWSTLVKRGDSDLQRLLHNDRAMIHWIFGTKDRDEIPSAFLLH